MILGSNFWIGEYREIHIQETSARNGIGVYC